jgi:hypothetical protein
MGAAQPSAVADSPAILVAAPLTGLSATYAQRATSGSCRHWEARLVRASHRVSRLDRQSEWWLFVLLWMTQTGSF